MTARGALLVYARAHATLDRPLVPAAWDVTQETSRWCSISPAPGVVFHCRLMIRRSGFSPHRALFVCVGTPAAMQYLADRIAADGLPWTLTWANLAAFRADATPAVATLRGEWPSAEAPGGLARLLTRMAGYLDDDAEA